MKQFLAGVVFAVIAICLAVYLVLSLGGVRATADSPPGGLETWLARRALGGYLKYHVGHEANPVPKTDANLKAGAKLYKDQCMGCHGDYQGSPNPFGEAMNPPIPQFGKDPPVDLPQPLIFFIAKHGLRMTGMPSFGKAADPMLKDEEIWKLALFLQDWKGLPPDVKAYMLQKPGAH